MANAYNFTSLAPLSLSPDGIVSVAVANAYNLTSLAPLSLSPDGIIGVEVANAYDLTSLAPHSLSPDGIMGVEVANAYESHRLSSSLSLSPDGIVSVAVANAYSLTSLAALSLSFSLDDREWSYISNCVGRYWLKGTASRYPLITLLQIGIHGYREYLLSYRDFYVLSYRPVGVNQMVIVFLTYYLPQHQHQAPGVLATRSLALLATY